jgi:hypothetical protein
VTALVSSHKLLPACFLLLYIRAIFLPDNKYMYSIAVSFCGYKRQMHPFPYVGWVVYKRKKPACSITNIFKLSNSRKSGKAFLFYSLLPRENEGVNHLSCCVPLRT